ncbi:hypothetical protein HZS_4323 [Henneguya salminicola]|nr:hypothetical protein HZS_4323 [Henneguya salminicola]
MYILSVTPEEFIEGSFGLIVESSDKSESLVEQINVAKTIHVTGSLSCCLCISSIFFHTQALKKDLFRSLWTRAALISKESQISSLSQLKSKIPCKLRG